MASDFEKTHKNYPKTSPDPLKTRPRTSLRLLERPQDAPRTFQDDSSWPQDASKTLQDTPRRMQDAIQTPQGLPETPQAAPRRFHDPPKNLPRPPNPPKNHVEAPCRNHLGLHCQRHFKLKINSKHRWRVELIFNFNVLMLLRLLQPRCNP